ncbi:hypothetical protein Tco_1363351 [Tanacetum coccineum]
MTKLRVFTIRAILDNKQQHGNTGNGKDKLSYTTTTLIYITTTDKHGVPPTKRLFRVAMLDPSQGFMDPWGKFGDLELPSVVRISWRRREPIGAHLALASFLANRYLRRNGPYALWLLFMIYWIGRINVSHDVCPKLRPMAKSACIAHNPPNEGPKFGAIKIGASELPGPPSFSGNLVQDDRHRTAVPSSKFELDRVQLEFEPLPDYLGWTGALHCAPKKGALVLCHLGSVPDPEVEAVGIVSLLGCNSYQAACDTYSESFPDKRCTCVLDMILELEQEAWFFLSTSNARTKSLKFNSNINAKHLGGRFELTLATNALARV